MSQEFGLDWIYYDHKRIDDLMLVMNIIHKQSKTDVSTDGINTTDGRQRGG